MTSVLLKGGDLVTDAYIGKHNWRLRQRLRWGQRIPKISRKTPEARGMGQILPHSPQKEPILLTLSFWMSSLKNCETIYLYCLNHPACETLLWNPWQTNKLDLWSNTNAKYCLLLCLLFTKLLLYVWFCNSLKLLILAVTIIVTAGFLGACHIPSSALIISDNEVNRKWRKDLSCRKVILLLY